MTELLATASAPDTSAEVISYLQALGIAEAHLELLNAGCHNTVYVCEDAFPVFPEKVVIRVPDCPEAGRPIEANAAYLEGTSAPRTLHIGTLALGGTPIIIEEFVEGTHKDLGSLTLKEIHELAATIASVHDRTSSCFSNRSGGPPICSGTYGDYLQAMVTESVTDRLRHTDMSSHVEAEQLVAAGMKWLYGMLKARPKLFGGSRFSLLHHDLNPDNMLWGPRRPVRFIDWNATFGDAADDIDYVVTNNPVPPGFRETFFDAYSCITGRDDIVARADVYKLKNQLDDLVWIIGMQQRCGEDERYGSAAYERRLVALQDTLALT